MIKQFVLFLTFVLSLNSAIFATEHQASSEEKKDTFVTGETLQGPSSMFTIVEKLGEGAFGEVYSVENETGEKFAIKFYKPKPSGWDTNHPYNDAEREFQRGQFLDHPHILKSVALFPHVIGTNEEAMIIVLEFVDGMPLFMTKRATFTQQQVMDATLKLVDALKYAMAYDLYHLDLHAGNVMIDKQFEPKVIDLASFFEISELIVSLPEEQKTEKDQTVSATAKQLLPERQGPQRKANVPLKPKMKKFIQNNPEIIQQLKKRVNAEKGKQAKKANTRHHKSLTTPASSDTEIKITESIRAPIHSYYFNMISDICGTMVYLSELDKDQKINLHAEIKKIAWSYEYDVKEGNTPNFEEYVDQLTSLLLNSST